jgi:hypothetical protein
LSTIRCLSEIDQKTAKLFTDLSPLISNNVIFISQEDKNKQFSDFLALQEAGLVAGVEASLSINIPVSDDNTWEWSDEHLYLKITKNSGAATAIPCIALTKSGRELLTLVDRSGTHGERMNLIYNAIPRHGIQSFSIHLITGKSENQINYVITPIKKWPEDAA